MILSDTKNLQFSPVCKIWRDLIGGRPISEQEARRPELKPTVDGLLEKLKEKNCEQCLLVTEIQKLTGDLEDRRSSGLGTSSWEF